MIIITSKASITRNFIFTQQTIIERESISVTNKNTAKENYMHAHVFTVQRKRKKERELKPGVVEEEA